MSEKDEDPTDGAVRLGLGLVALAIILVAILYYLQTREIWTLIVGGLVALAVPLLEWINRDARRVGVPVWPWMLVNVLLPGLGLGLYLVAREVRLDRADG